MKRLLSVLIILSTIVLSACTTADNSDISSSIETSSNPTAEYTVEKPAITESVSIQPVTPTEKPLSTKFSINQTSDKFISPTQFNYIYTYGDWIYYSSGTELRKCSKDLTENTFIKGNVRGFTMQDSIMYFVIHSINGQQEIYKMDISSDEENIEKVIHFSKDRHLAAPIPYGDNIFCISCDNSYRLTMLDRNGKYPEFLSKGEIYSYGIIDKSIYYYEYQNDCIMKYDLEKEENEVFCKTDVTDIYPETDGTTSMKQSIYFNRYIILETNYGSFTYYNIDDGTSHNLQFDLSEFEHGRVSFTFNGDDKLYFTAYETSPSVQKASCKIYEVNPESAEIEFISSADCRKPVYISDGYIYDGSMYDMYSDNSFIPNQIRLQ